jgi:hypothetical protein
MAIRPRVLPSEDEQLIQKFSLPPELLSLFNSVLPMGTILPRHRFFREELPKYYNEGIQIGDMTYSVRPAWSSYRDSPSTHLIIIGHIIICHVLKDTPFYYQPSVRLFNDDAKTRMKNFEALLQRAVKYKGWEKPVAVETAIG